MKQFAILNMITLQVFLFFSISLAQVSDKEWDLMLIREDIVEPSMTVEYETGLMDLKNFLSENKHVKFNYFVHLQDDYVFRHVTPLKNIQELEKGIHNLISKKADNAQLDLILDYLNEAITSYNYYIVQYKRELSYLPEGDDWAAGNPFRRWSYYNFQPGMEDEVEKVLSAWKSLYERKGISSGFRVFKGFIGTDQPLYIFTTWGANPMEYHQNLELIAVDLGEEGGALWSKMMEMVNGVNTIEGWLLPQYSYAPGLEMAK